MKTVTVLGIIPARHASTRFPGKPLAPLGGKPIVQRTYEAARRCTRLDELIVATDDERIADVARGFGAGVVMTDPDCPSGSDRAAQAMRVWEGEQGRPADIVVNIQGDEPFIDPAVVDAAVAALQRPLGDHLPDVATAMTPIRDAESAKRTDIVKVVVGRDSRALYFSRSPIPCLARASAEEFAGAYDNLHGAGIDGRAPIHGFKHLGLYVFHREALLRFIGLPPSPLERLERLEQLRMLENGMSIALVATAHDLPGIDTPQDLARAELLLNQLGPTE